MFFDSAVIHLETSSFDKKPPSQVRDVYDCPFSFQVHSVCIYAPWCCAGTEPQQARKCCQTMVTVDNKTESVFKKLLRHTTGQLSGGQNYSPDKESGRDSEISNMLDILLIHCNKPETTTKPN